MNVDICNLAVCPHCGHEKEILNLLSGNTFRATLWSDSKQVSTMLPSVSPIQKCPSCGKFYLMDEVQIKEGENYSFEQGWLSFDDAVDAYNQLNHNRDITQQQMFVLVLVWAYNDMLRTAQTPTDAQFQTLKQLLTKALQNPIFQDNVLIRAEFYREIEEFNQCIQLLESFTPDDDFLISIRDKILDKAKAGERQVFILYKN